MPEPLEGITVIEMTIAVQGPAAGLYLRDMGATVVKVEPPLGDPSRYTRGRDNHHPNGSMGPQYAAVNRGKRSLCIDLKTTAGMQALHALLATADVFVTNYRAAALAALDLDYDSLKTRYPNLIYAAVNGFGPLGPDQDKAMLDGVAASRGGLIHHTGHSDRTPSLIGAIVLDTAGAMQLALSIMTALFARVRYNVGQQVQTSALGAALWLQQWELTHVGMTQASLPRAVSHHPNITGFYGVYTTRDNGAIMLAQVMDQESWDRLCIFADALELSLDPRFQTPGQRLGAGLTDADTLEVRRIFGRAFASKDTATWIEFLSQEPEIIWERVNSWQDVLNDPQNRANDYLTEIHVDGVGRSTTVGNLVRLSETPGSVKGDPPVLGEANNDILSSLGIDQAVIDDIEQHATATRVEWLTELQQIADAAAGLK